MELLKEYIKSIIQEGIFEPPPAMVQKIGDWAVEEINNYRKLSRQGLVRGLKKEQDFKIDLTGWKYGDVLQDYLRKVSSDSQDMIEFLKKQFAKRRAEGLDLSQEKEQEWIDMVLAGSKPDRNDKIKVRLQLIGDSNLGGTWHKGSSTLDLYFILDKHLII